MELSAKEKILAILNLIDEKSEISHCNDELFIYEYEINKYFSENDMATLLDKLSNLNVLEYSSHISSSNAQSLFSIFPIDFMKKCICISKKEGFNKYKLELEKDLDITKNNHNEKHRICKKLWLSYDCNDRAILLNDIFVLHTMNEGSENHKIFELLWRNVNKSYSKDEIMKEVNLKSTKDLHAIVRDWKFTKELKDIFIQVSTTSIKLIRTQLTEEEFDSMKIKRVDIR